MLGSSCSRRCGGVGLYGPVLPAAGSLSVATDAILALCRRSVLSDRVWFRSQPFGAGRARRFYDEKGSVA